MRKSVLLMTVLFMAIILTGCGKNDVEKLAEEVKKIELTGNLVTYEAYYHNVLEYTKEKGTGLVHWFEKDKKLFAEYTGTIKLGINLSKVKIEVAGKDVNVIVPKATVIGEPNVDRDDFKSENFIESEDGINKNEITADDSASAFDEAQQNMKIIAENDSELLSIAQKRAKVIIEENVNQFLKNKKYTINWEYEQ